MGVIGRCELALVTLPGTFYEQLVVKRPNQRQEEEYRSHQQGSAQRAVGHWIGLRRQVVGFVVPRNHTFSHGVIRTYLMRNRWRSSIFAGSPASMVMAKTWKMRYWVRLVRSRILRFKGVLVT